MTTPTNPCYTYGCDNEAAITATHRDSRGRLIEEAFCAVHGSNVFRTMLTQEATDSPVAYLTVKAIPPARERCDHAVYEGSHPRRCRNAAAVTYTSDTSYRDILISRCTRHALTHDALQATGADRIEWKTGESYTLRGTNWVRVA